MATALQSQVSIAGGLYEFSDSYDARTPTFRDRLAAPVRIEKRLPDLFQGLQTRQETRIRLKNVALWTPTPAGTVLVGEEVTTYDVTASDILAGSEGLAGKSAAATLYCLDSSTEIARLDGVIVDAREAAGGAMGMEEGEITINALDLDALQQLVPKVRLLDQFPNADVADLSGSDLPVVVLFGQVRKLRLAYLGRFSGRYCFGAVRFAAGITWDAVYRNKAVVDASEYTVLTINGCSVIGFTRDQIDGTGRRFVLQADVTGTEFTRPSDAGKFILNDPTYGLGLSVNSASFTAAAAAYAAVSYNVGGGLTQRVQAQVVLNKLALRGAIIQRNSSGEYTWTVDAASQHVAASVTLGKGDGYWENIDRVISKSHKRVEERVKKIVLQGLLDNGFEGSPTYLLTAQRTRPALTGAELSPEQNEWIGDATTLDRETDYRFKSLIEGERELALTVEVGDTETPCGRVLALNQVVPVVIPNLRLDGTTGDWTISELATDARGVDVTLRGYNAAVYTYTPGVVQSAPSVTYQPDYTFTLPDAPGGFGIVSSIIVTASDGSKSVIATMEADAPAVNVSHLVFQVFRNTSVIPVWQRQVTVAKGQQNVQVAFHLPVGDDADNTYDLQCFARNVANAVGFQDGLVAQILNWAPGTDTVDPTAPTGLTATVGTGKLITLNWTANPVAEGVQRYGIYRHPTNAPASATLIATEDSTTYVDATVSIGATYYYWVTAYDRFENESVKSTVAGPVSPTEVPPDATAPANPGALTFSSQTTYQSSEGIWFGSVTFAVPAMPARAVIMNGLYRRDGTTPWLIGNQVTSGGGTMTFDALTTGLFYDFALVAYSAFGIASAIVEATGNPRFVPPDAVAPTVPVLTSLESYNWRSVVLNWNPVADGDFGEYRIYWQAIVNIADNFSFEKLGWENWTVGGTAGAFSQTTLARHTGAYGARIIADGTSLALIQSQSVTNGATYTLGGWVRIPTWVSGNAIVRVNKGDGTFATALSFSGVSGWTYGSVTFTATGTTATIECRVSIGGDLTAYFDDIIFVAGTPTAATLLGEASVTKFTDTNQFAEGNAYFYAVAARDRSENESAKSDIWGITPVRIPNEDLPNNTPLALTGLAISSSGTYQASDGTTLAYVVLTWTNPTDTKRAFVEVAFRRNGNTTSYLIGDQVTGTTARIDDLTPGLGYDYRVRGCSHTGYFGTAATLSNQVAPGDTTAPAQVTGLTLSDHPPRGILARWTASTADDLANYEIQTATDSGFTANVITRTSKTTELPLTALTNGTTYFVRVRAKDLTGNNGTYSTTASRTVPRSGTDDYGDDSVTTVKIANLAVTNAKINDLSATKITTGLLTVNPSSGGATGIFVDNAGKIILKALTASPSKIVFTNASSIEKIDILGSASGLLTIQPTVDIDGSIAFGNIANRFSSFSANAQTFDIASTGSFTLTCSGLTEIQGTTGVLLTGLLRTNQVVAAAPGGTLNKYINVYNSAGTFQGRIAIYS